MSGHKPYDAPTAAVSTDPTRRDRMNRDRRLMRDVSELARLREARGAPQEVVARAWQVSQANMSRAEPEDDVYLSTLCRYVEALGGRLEISAVFPDQTIHLRGSYADHLQQPLA